MGSRSRLTQAEKAVSDLILYAGDDPKREGLGDTPSRVVRAYKEWFSGYGQFPEEFLAADFSDGAEKADEIVLLTNIPVQSHCEHHMTPFVGVAHVAYIPSGRIVGLSKLARVVNAYSRRLQVQERLTNQIVDCINQVLDPIGAAVIVTAEHFCMATRGICKPGIKTTTSALRGVFKTEHEARSELFQLIAQATK